MSWEHWMATKRSMLGMVQLPKAELPLGWCLSVDLTVWYLRFWAKSSRAFGSVLADCLLQTTPRPEGHTPMNTPRGEK